MRIWYFSIFFTKQQFWKNSWHEIKNVLIERLGVIQAYNVYGLDKLHSCMYYTKCAWNKNEGQPGVRHRAVTFTRKTESLIETWWMESAMNIKQHWTFTSHSTGQRISLGLPITNYDSDNCGASDEIYLNIHLVSFSFSSIFVFFSFFFLTIHIQINMNPFFFCSARKWKLSKICFCILDICIYIIEIAIWMEKVQHHVESIGCSSRAPLSAPTYEITSFCDLRTWIDNAR